MRVVFGVPKLQRVLIIAAYATCVAIWGTTWLGIKVSLDYIPPVAGAGLRFLLAGTVLYLAAFARGVDLRKATPPFHLIVALAISMFGANYALTYLAETHLASGLVAVLFGTLPFFLFAFAHFMVGERATPGMLVGALLALGGVATISLAGNVHADLPYVVAVLAASAFSAFANAYLKKYADAEPLTTLAPAMLLAGAAMAVGGIRFEGIDWSRALSAPSLGALAYLALCGSALAFYLNHWLLQRIDAGAVGLTALMIPVVAVIVGALFGHEVFGVRDIVGGLLVIAGVWLALRPQAAAEPHSRLARVT